ncbi:hypothetical protein ACG98H_03660 [Corynebacterium sp. L4756]|uniref:hypothetical protein n=1 Tax=unclassified Corynebacterium TaxID=2624378 RepID=UPI00374C9797
MSRAFIYLVLGAVLVALGIWWWTVIGPSFAFLAPLIVMSVGGAFVVGGIAVALDVHSPTSRKI